MSVNLEDMDTTDLLDRLAQGVEAARDVLLARHLEWIRGRVRRRLGSALRTKLDSGDVVQEAFLNFLRYGPLIRIQRGDHFRRLMALIIENTLRDANDHWHCERRNLDREVDLQRACVLDLTSSGSFADPAHAAEVAEDRALLDLVQLLLSPGAREVFQMRARDGHSFKEIGERLGIRPEAADSRYRRAARQCATYYKYLKERNLTSLLDLVDRDARGERERSTKDSLPEVD